MHRIAQPLYSQKTLHILPLRASYGVSFVSILAKNNRVMKGFYCTNGGNTVTIIVETIGIVHFRYVQDFVQKIWFVILWLTFFLGSQWIKRNDLWYMPSVWDFSSPLSCKMWLPSICQDIPYCVMPLAGRLQAILLWRQVWQAYVVNLLWPNDTLWRHKPGSTLSKLIDQCPMAPMHCLNQWWLLTVASDQYTILFINYSFKNQTLHGDCRIYLKNNQTAFLCFAIRSWSAIFSQMFLPQTSIMISYHWFR